MVVVVVVVQNLSSHCCGMLFNSRGFTAAAATKGADLEQALLEASENGKIPIVCDTSPCLAQIKTSLSQPALRCEIASSLPSAHTAILMSTQPCLLGVD